MSEWLIRKAERIIDEHKQVGEDLERAEENEGRKRGGVRLILPVGQVHSTSLRCAQDDKGGFGKKSRG